MNNDIKQAPSAASLMWQGIFWKVASCACFAGVNALVRFLSGGASIATSQPLPIYVLMFIQNSFGALLILIWLLSGKKRDIFKTNQPTWHLIRVTTAVIGVAVWYLSLHYIPITQAVALSFIGPVVTLIFATIMLQEKLDLPKTLAIILSIIGGLLITRPDKGLSEIEGLGLTALLPMISATIFAFDKILTRKLMVTKESPKQLTFFLLAFMGPMSLIPVLFTGWVAPLPDQYPWLILLALLGVLAHYTFSKAYALAEVTILMPFGISKIVLCGLVGYFAFGELPRSLAMWLGIGVILLSTLLLGQRKKTVKLNQKFA